MKAQTVKNRIYHAARKKGKTVKQARKIAKDLDEKLVESHRKMVQLDRETLAGELRAGIMGHKRTRIRQETGLSYTTLKTIVEMPYGYVPAARTMHSLARYLDMELKLNKRTRTGNVIPIRRR